ncbi:cytosine-specific methyltransferase [Clostridia bacterium]|nr:cytosine-specific methyltransferase [Clostridia bacterium]
MKKQVLHVGSLFAGVGGICLAFLSSETDTVEYKMEWANEIDKYACETYRTNFKHPLIEGDIYKILNPSLCKDEKEQKRYEGLNAQILSKKIDVLNGGFPCQAFSIAGQRKGFNDERGHLFLAIIELIQKLSEKHDKPRFLFLENVKNLLTHDNNKTYAFIKSKLETEGYTVIQTVLNTMDYTDLPQNRERLYILGFQNIEDSEKFMLFKNLSDYRTTKFVSGDKRVLSLINKIVPEKYYYTKDKYPLYYNDKVNLDIDINEKGQFYQLRRGMYVRKNKSNVCPTLTANMGTGGHNVPLIRDAHGIRKLTPAETFKLQGFPVDNGYVLPSLADSYLYKQAGNSVSVPMIKLIITELAKCVQ